MSAESQFNTYRFELENEQIEVVRWMPEDEKGQPILVVPGWGETMRSFSDVLEELTTLNRPVFGITHLREHIPKGGIKNPHLLQEYKAKNIIAVLEMLKLKNVDVVGHSEASVNVSIAASTRPDLFDDIVLIAPTAVSPIKNRWYFRWLSAKKLFVDAWEALKDKQRRPIYMKHFGEGFRYQVSRPIRSIYELVSIANIDIQESLVELNKKHHVSLLIMDKDFLYPAEEILAHMADTDINIEVFPGWHDELHFNPEAYVKYFAKRMDDKSKPGRK